MAGDIRKELLTATEVAKMLAMGRSTFYDFIRDDPFFPKPLLMGKGKDKKWVLAEIEWYLRLCPRTEQPEEPTKADAESRRK